jgi:hypothetical protein
MCTHFSSAMYCREEKESVKLKCPWKKNYVAALIKMFKESLQTIKLIILNQLWQVFLIRFLHRIT